MLLHVVCSHKLFESISLKILNVFLKKYNLLVHKLRTNKNSIKKGYTNHKDPNIKKKLKKKNKSADQIT